MNKDAQQSKEEVRSDGKTVARPGAPRSKIGRPTQAELAERLDALLDYALDMFLERGFEQTTVVAIAKQAGMSKRTVYEHYQDKDDLFKAAVQRALDRYTVSLETLRACISDDLESTLTAVARVRVANASTPAGVKLQRILIAQSYRFPELWAVLEKSIEPTVVFLSELFAHPDHTDEIHVSNARRTAIAFISLVVSGPTRLISSGKKLSQEEIETRIRFTVQLFLNGIRRR